MDRSSHDDFFRERDWNAVEGFWRGVIGAPMDAELPRFLAGSAEFGVTSVEKIHSVGVDTGEFDCPDPRYANRKSFCIRIGYNGSEFHGFQHQPGGIQTVESDLKICLNGRTVMAAGRTDKDVSALSQIVCFSTFDPLGEEDILRHFRESEPAKAGRLAAFECWRVPRRMHPLFMATWRRYTYVFPVLPGSFEGWDIDVAFVDAALRKIVGKALPYNNFAYGAMPVTIDGAYDDICTILHASAKVVNLTQRPPAGSSPALCIELVGNRFLRRMVRHLVATVCRAATQADRNADVLVNICTGGKRSDVAMPCPGVGLALTGVGFNMAGMDRRVAIIPESKAPKSLEFSVRKERKARKKKALVPGVCEVVEMGDSSVV